MFCSYDVTIILQQGIDDRGALLDAICLHVVPRPGHRRCQAAANKHSNIHVYATTKETRRIGRSILEAEWASDLPAGNRPNHKPL
jgi:hypothetical protein